MVVQTLEPGPYGYCLNMALPATSGAIVVNSKRVMRDFRLLKFNAAFQFSVAIYSLILGTQDYNWFADFVRIETIAGDGALPHYIPGGGMDIKCGDYITATVRNDNSTAKRIALIFDGINL